MSIQYRSEHDSVGERSVPKDVYYGVQSLRAAENFPITGLAVHPEQINSIAEIKKASAITNLEIGLLDKRVADAIVRACDEIAAGRLHEAFIVDPIQGGAGTSLNMNANEVIANRERCRDMVEHSVGIITALCPHVGYEKAAEVAKRAIETGAPVRRLILEEGLLDEAALDKILDPYSMTEPGISGKELLEG